MQITLMLNAEFIINNNKEWINYNNYKINVIQVFL